MKSFRRRRRSLPLATAISGFALIGIALVCSFPIGTVILGAAPGEADPARALEHTRRYLSLPPKEFKAATARLSPQEAENLISQIIHLRSKRNPDLVRLHQILRHLETIRATALAQKRLNRLLLVLITILFIFSGVLIHTSLTQRRILKKILSAQSGRDVTGSEIVGQAFTGQETSGQEKHTPVYRGEDSS